MGLVGMGFNGFSVIPAGPDAREQSERFARESFPRSRLLCERSAREARQSHRSAPSAQRPHNHGLGEWTEVDTGAHTNASVTASALARPVKSLGVRPGEGEFVGSQLDTLTGIVSRVSFGRSRTRLSFGFRRSPSCTTTLSDSSSDRRRPSDRLRGDTPSIEATSLRPSTNGLSRGSL